MGKKYEFLYMIYVGIVVMATAFGGGWLINNLQLMIFGEDQVILLIKNHAFKIIGCLYLLVLFSVLSVLLYKKAREFVMYFIRGNKDSTKKAKAIWVSVFISINILLLYTMVMDVSVVKEDYIYNYSVLKI